MAHAVAHEMAALDAAVGGLGALWDALEEDLELLVADGTTGGRS